MISAAVLPVTGSQYRNNFNGGAPGETYEDAEGMQALLVLARNAKCQIMYMLITRGQAAG